jgi:hypothetical protein
VNANLGAARRERGQQAVRPHLGEHRHAPAVHVDRADLVRAAAAHGERDARTEHAASSCERLHDVVRELVDGVADVGVTVALGQRRRVAARDHEHLAFQRAARGLHLHDRLSADLRPQRRRERHPLAVQLGWKRLRVEDLEQAGDVHVLRQRLDGGRGRTPSRARPRASFNI